MKAPNGPLISVALCTYNGAAFIGEQLQSILDQSYKNIELVVVDDCSSDNTYDIVESYAKNCSRITTYRNPATLGYNKNFARAISLTTGDLIAISDQDDRWIPSKLEELHAAINDNWLISSNSRYLTEDGTVTDQLLRPNFSLKGFTYKAMLLNNFVTGHTMLFKRSLMDHILPIPAAGYYDWWIGFIAAYHQKIVYLDKPLTLHRLHGGSVMQKQEHGIKKRRKKEIYRSVADQLDCFLTYRDLKDEDRNFITRLRSAFVLKEGHRYSLPLTGIVFKHYNELFPGLKKRSFFSKISFALRQSKGI